MVGVVGIPLTSNNLTVKAMSNHMLQVRKVLTHLLTSSLLVQDKLALSLLVRNQEHVLHHDKHVHNLLQCASLFAFLHSQRAARSLFAKRLHLAVMEIKINWFATMGLL
jgi:hypothetical protein